MKVATIELTRDGATLNIDNHHYPLIWDDEHPDPRPEAERILATYEGICSCHWHALKPIGWDTPVT